MDKSLIPTDLHDLISMVEKWGLPDDSYRDEKLFNASKIELKEIILSLPNDKLETLNNWLVDFAEDQVVCMTDEYVNFTCYIMAYDMARVLLKKI